jgi:hypothetical protein
VSDVNFGCEGKFKYPDKPSADRVARLSSARQDRAVTSYKCSVCKGWHIGRPVGKKERRL